MTFIKNNLNKVLIVAIAIVVLVPTMVSAASISLEPDRESVNERENVSISVYIEPEGETFYAAKTQVEFSDNLTINEDIENFEVYSNFIPVSEDREGVLIRSAGYPQGASERVEMGKITLTASETGTANISLNMEESQIYAVDNNRARGILSDTSNAQINITSTPGESGAQSAQPENESEEGDAEEGGEEGVETDEEGVDEGEQTEAGEEGPDRGGGMAAAFAAAWQNITNSKLLIPLILIILLSGGYFGYRRYRKEQKK